MLHVEKLAPDVDIGNPGADGMARDEAALEDHMGIPLQQQMILERARLALVGVADDVFRLGGVLDDKLPFHAGREAGAAAAFQSGCLHQIDHLRRRHRERFTQAFVAFVLQIEVERIAVRLANEFGEDGIHVVVGRWSLVVSLSR